MQLALKYLFMSRPFVHDLFFDDVRYVVRLIDKQPNDDVNTNSWVCFRILAIGTREEVNRGIHSKYLNEQLWTTSLTLTQAKLLNRVDFVSRCPHRQRHTWGCGELLILVKRS
jgi:hypothetical protein